MVDNSPLPPEELGPRLAEVYAVLGPLYRRVARLVEHDSPRNGLSIGVRAVHSQCTETSHGLLVFIFLILLVFRNVAGIFIGLVTGSMRRVLCVAFGIVVFITMLITLRLRVIYVVHNPYPAALLLMC